MPDLDYDEFDMFQDLIDASNMTYKKKVSVPYVPLKQSSMAERDIEAYARLLADFIDDDEPVTKVKRNMDRMEEISRNVDALPPKTTKQLPQQFPKHDDRHLLGGMTTIADDLFK